MLIRWHAQKAASRLERVIGWTGGRLWQQAAAVARCTPVIHTLLVRDLRQRGPGLNGYQRCLAVFSWQKLRRQCKHGNELNICTTKMLTNNQFKPCHDVKCAKSEPSSNSLMANFRQQIHHINRGYYMAARRYEISLRVLKKCFPSERSEQGKYFSTREDEFHISKRSYNVLFII